MTGHVLVARLDSAGDVLLAGPAVRAVAAHSDRVTMLCGRRGRAAAALLPGVDHVEEYTAEWIDPDPGPVDPSRVEHLVGRLRRLEADAAVILTSFHQSPLPLALLLRMAGVPFVGAISEDYPGSLLDVRHRVDDDVHEVERSLSCAAACGFPLPPDDDRALRIKTLSPAEGVGTDEPYVVVHPGASVPARAWDPVRHAELVRRLTDKGRRVVVTGGADERSLTAFVTRNAGERATDLGGRTDFPSLAAVLSRAEVVVTGNTGPAHLAAAVGRPVVSLFAPTVPACRWRPWGVPYVLLGVQDVACAGCRARVCDVPGQPCLGGIGVEDVVDAIDRLAHPAQLQEVTQCA